MEQSKRFQNPILPGFYPDPSVLRVGEDYYLVTSSFAYYPGVPIFHSKDLVHWRQIGHVLDRPSQLPLKGAEQSRGIFAPTLRYHDGVFYMITTNISGGGNFLVTAANPAGPWSEPYWLDAPGIDPSLFFDDDGRAWYVGTHEVPEGGCYFGDNEIYLRELDLKTLTLKPERFGLWRGALKDAIWAEGPHLYKINGFYYLMISEGGTDYHHAVTIARSPTLKGPYEGNKANPILTHRHLGRGYPIVNTGHADLVETPNGEWWMVLLASRPYGGYYRNLGRETFMVPVIWEDGWPVVSPGTGKVEFSYPSPSLPERTWQNEGSCDHFDEKHLRLSYNTIRTPAEAFCSLTERPGYLRVRSGSDGLNGLGEPAFIGRRQQHINFKARTVVEFSPEHEGDTFGLALFQNHRYHFRLEATRKDGKLRIQLVACRDGEESVLVQKPLAPGRFELMVTALGQYYNFYYGSEDQPELLYGKADGRILSTDVAGGFVGTYIGVFAANDEVNPSFYADVDLFEYSGT